MAHQFDELAKALAEGVSRREALRRIGPGVVGAVLASLGMGRAWAQSPQCRAYCQQQRAAGATQAQFIACLQNCATQVGPSSLSLGLFGMLALGWTALQLRLRKKGESA
jgi:hypothetical protein